MSSKRGIAIAAIVATTIVGSALAQTSRFLYYDMRQAREINGTVQQLDWMNPNSELRVSVKNEATGKIEEWSFVMGPPTRSIRSGWSSDSLKRGDPVTLTMYPSRDGSHSGQLVSATLPDGRTLQATEPNPAR